MKIYDISQEVFSCCIYPNDPKPRKEVISDTEKGDLYNLSAFYMCAHNGTHIDAPYHFIPNGATVESIPLEKVIGYAYVAECDGLISADDAKIILRRAKNSNAESARRILLKGDCTVTADAARVFAQEGIYLIGNEGQTVGPFDAPMEVHLILLSAEAVLLEGIRLSGVKEGVYFLNAAPLSLGGCDGAPCRATLTEL